MNALKRIAIYGGTFDPVHNGHLQIGRRISELFAIDDFLFMPARVAPHKTDRDAASAFDRYAMLTLATQTDDRLSVSRFELDGAGRQYTVDTLRHFRELCGQSTDLLFVMGADSWSEIRTWREWQTLSSFAAIAVVTRPNVEVQPQAANEMQASTVDVRGGNTPIENVAVRQVFFSDVVEMDVSSTRVRKVAYQNDYEELQKLVPRSVADYIRKYGLYRNTNET